MRSGPEPAEELRRSPSRLGAPVVTTLNAKGIVDERDPLSLGHARSRPGKAALPHADAMLAVGCRFTEVMTDWRRMPVPRQLVQIDLDPDQIGMNYPVAVGIVADARAALAALRERSAGPHRRERLGRAPGRRPESARHPRPEWLIETLREELPERRPRLHRRLRDGLSDAGRLALLRPAPVLLSVELHHARLGLPGRGRRGRRRSGTGPSSRSAATAAS